MGARDSSDESLHSVSNGSDGKLPPDRQCGRCRRLFAGDPEMFFQPEWALCPECEKVLLPDQPSRSPGAGPP